MNAWGKQSWLRLCQVKTLQSLALLLSISTNTPSRGAEPGFKLVWPTPSPDFYERRPLKTYIQPTASGRINSGLFGCQRNNGQRFHEGIDLKALRRDRHGEAEDAILAAMAGTIVYINTHAGNSKYGRYVVLVHDTVQPAVYTLYAHLSHIARDIQKGVSVQAGTILGTMGRSAGGYTIPKERAHLHFEIGLRLSNTFQSWYDQQTFRTHNYHGIWNGMNLVGIDPLDFYEKMRSDPNLTIDTYFRNLTTAFTVRVTTRKVPDFVRRYPTLLTQRLGYHEIYGWEIAFTGFGLPKNWKPLSATELPTTAKDDDISILSDDRGERETYSCHNNIHLRNQRLQPGEHLQRKLDILFNEKP